MAENKMEQVAAMFGKKMEEEFEIMRISGNRCKICQGKFTDKGLFICGWTDRPFQSDAVMRQLLTGRAEIVKE